MEILETREKLAALTFKPGQKILFSDILTAGYVFHKAYDFYSAKDEFDDGSWTYALGNVFLAGYIAGERGIKNKEKLAKLAARNWPHMAIHDIFKANYIFVLANDTDSGIWFENRDSYAITSVFVAGRIAGDRTRKEYLIAECIAKSLNKEKIRPESNTGRIRNV